MNDEPLTTDVLTMGLRSAYAPALVWIVGVISLGLGAQFAMDAGVDNRIVAAITLPLVAACLFTAVKTAFGDANTLRIANGVLTAQRGRRTDRVQLASAQVSLGHWTGGDSEGGAKLVGPVLILDVAGRTTTIGTTDAHLAQTLGADHGPLVKLDPAFVIGPEAFERVHQRVLHSEPTAGPRS